MKHKLPSKLISNRINISLAGCGGNGSQMLAGLPRLHTALRALGHPGLHVTAYDPDIITDANVGRQLFSPADIGSSKARVLINRINLYYGLNWRAVHGKLGPHASHPGPNGGPDILIGCVDTVKARQQLARLDNHGYWLDLGNTDKKGQVILGELREPQKVKVIKAKDFVEGNALNPAKQKDVTPAKLPHFFDLFPELKKKNIKEDNTPSCSLAEALERQDLFINQSVATFALQLLWQFFRQGGLDIHGYFINLETGRVSPLPIK